MANITLTIPDAQINRVLNALATKFGYTGFLSDGVTPQTKAQFAKAWIIKDIIAAVKDQEGNTLATTAINNNSSDIDSNIPIT